MNVKKKKKIKFLKHSYLIFVLFEMIDKVVKRALY